MAGRRRVIAKRTKKDKRNGVKREYYNVPDEIDLQILEEVIAKLVKSLDDKGRPKEITDTFILNLYRSAVREKWMHCDAKLAFLNSQLVPDEDINSRRRFKVQCNICKDWFAKGAVDVDHLVGNNSLTSLDQIREWTEKILYVGRDDLQILCTEGCHPIKTLSESHGITFKEAEVLKRVIAWEKEKIDHKEFLIDKGFTEKEVSNKTKRREAYIVFFGRLNEN